MTEYVIQCNSVALVSGQQWCFMAQRNTGSYRQEVKDIELHCPLSLKDMIT